MASIDDLLERFRQMRSEADSKRYRNSVLPEDAFIPKGQRADFAKRQAMLEQQAQKIEEEKQAMTILDKLELLGEDKGGLYLFDRDLDKMAAAAPGAE